MSSKTSFLASPYTQREAVLLVLDAFAKRGLVRVRQYEVHKAVWKLISHLPLNLRFITSPTIYSDDLDSLLHELERSHLVNELLVVHNGWVPKRMYQMTTAGRMVVAEVEARVWQENKPTLKAITEALDE